MLACSIDGAICAPGEALIPVDDHALLYGDGVFEGLRFYHGRLFRLAAHLMRLQDSAAECQFQLISELRGAQVDPASSG